MIRSNITLDRLADIPFVHGPVSKAKAAYIPHHLAACNILAFVASRGWAWAEPAIGITEDYRDMAISVPVRVPHVQARMEEGWSTLFGMFHSNSGHKRLAFYFGYQNDAEPERSMVLGMNMDTVRHDYRIKLAKEIDFRLKAFEAQAEKCRHLHHELMRFRIKNSEAQGCLYQAGRAGYMPWSRVGRVDEQFFKIPFKERTSGRLYELFCQETKINRPVPHQLKQCEAFRSLLPCRQVHFMM